MKILYLCTDAGIPVLGRKGASVHVRELIAALHRAGHTVILAAPVLNKSPWEIPAETAATVYPLKSSSSMLAVVQATKDYCSELEAQSPLPGELRRILNCQEATDGLARRFRNDPPDFIYERAALYGTGGVSLAKAFDVPLLVELNAPLAMEHSTYRGSGLQDLAVAAERHLFKSADAVFTVSAALREHVLTNGARAGDNVHVLPNGVDPTKFHPAPRNPAWRKRWNIGDEQPVLGFLGGLRPWHGTEVLPQLLERLRESYPALKLVIAGDGQLRPLLEADFEKRGLSSQVVFTGTISHEEAAEMIREFDIALAPYPVMEHAFYFSPLKLFEYMACGTAVVAADLGQIREVVTDGLNGLLYPAGNLEMLQSCCGRLLSNPKLRMSLGQEAAKLMQAEYTWDSNARKVASIARQLIEARRTGSLAPDP